MKSSTGNRRRFLWQAMDELLAACESRAWRPSLKLSGLRDLPDPVLAEIIPAAVRVSGADLPDGADDGGGADGSWGEVPPAWDGEKTLREISEATVSSTGVSRQRAWEDTKDLFFDLLSRGMTSPLNVPNSLRQP